jgi:hypothetical protein
MIIASNRRWYDIIDITLTHAAIYDYRLEPGDIDIIIADTCRFMIIALNLVISILLYHWHAAIYDYRLEPGDIDIIIALTHAAI